MYDELIKALRFCETHGTCRECVFCPKDAEDMRCNNLLTEAADAIEELQATLCNWCAVCPKDKRNLSTCEIYESCRAKPPKGE